MESRRDAEGVKKAEPELRRGPAELTAERKSVHKENWARGDAQPRGLRSAEAEAACGFGWAPKRERVARPTGRSREGCWAPRKSQGAPRERAGGRGPAPARLSHSSHLPLPPSPCGPGPGPPQLLCRLCIPHPRAAGPPLGPQHAER